MKTPNVPVLILFILLAGSFPVLSEQIPKSADHMDRASREVAFDFALDDQSSSPPDIVCELREHTLVLLDGGVVLRNVRWRTRDGAIGCGFAINHRKQTGHFWFFNADNIELTCKALDATLVNGKFWIFCGSLTDVEFWVEAVNNGTPSISKQYHSESGRMASFGDVDALPIGTNRVPIFLPGYCGAHIETVRSHKGIYILAKVNDPDGDPLAITAKTVDGESDLGLRRESPPWAEEGEIVYSFDAPNEQDDYLVEIEASDGKTLVPPVCKVSIAVR